MDWRGWTIWCRETAANYRRGASLTTGRRSLTLSNLAAHYEAQASESGAMAGNKPSVRRDSEQPSSKKDASSKDHD
jgi:hypothetical protein